ncbi:SDR family NAD(P)-dependent oxidoreductase [Roseinatronobacter sp.]|uniref:SDR family NAD(P)-dependent oxidoreductase n=1 Tax=Roseinatronobacter sp. TaxID=1945755 RepID=UPI0025F2DD34|nr:SDR family NAD(P)-dependent oxidoreductase [Roseibaca sp.]
MKVLVTGGASGLGAALVAACRARGDEVCAIDLDPAERSWAHDLGNTDPAAWAALADWLATQGPFDLVILSAGISATGRFETIPLAQHQNVTAVNLAGPIRLVHLLESGHLLRAGGRLIFIASLSCFTGYPGAASYAASKDGLAGFARSLRRPMRKRGITVQLACPGPMDTPHATRYAPDGASTKGRLAPDRAAQAILNARSFTIIPGAGPKLAAFLGRLAPQTLTRLMGRVLFSKLK